jgi:hypothetical protein
VTDTNGDKPKEDGFELAGRFYRWHVTDMGKDLMLIDRFSGLPITEFFAQIDDQFDRGRAPILLTLIATSVRHGNPDWSVARIERTVLNLNLSDVTFVDADQEPAENPPPASADETPTGDTSRSPSTGSSASSTPPDDSTSETLYAIPA